MKTRDRIMESAFKLFSEKGYLGATTKEIAKVSGVAEVTLFRHFPSKEKLFEETVKSRSFLPAFRVLIPEIKKIPYEDALELIAERFLETLALRKDLIRIMHLEMHRYPEEIKEIYHSFLDGIFNSLASYFEELQREGVLRKFDTGTAARAFLGMFFAYFNAEEFLMRRQYRSLDQGKVIESFTNIFARGTKKPAHRGRSEVLAE